MRQKSATATFLAARAVTVLLLVSVACQSSPPMAEVQALPTHPPTWPTDTPAETTSPAMPTLPVPTLSPESAVAAELDAERAVSTAKASLIVRLGVAEEAIVVKAVEAVQWHAGVSRDAGGARADVRISHGRRSARGPVRGGWMALRSHSPHAHSPSWHTVCQAVNAC
jgi:hypothetical protein